jgi:hypothetical protein
MAFPPIIGRGPPRVLEPRGRKAGASAFSVPEPQETAGTEAPMAAAAATPLLALQAESDLRPARALTEVAGEALRNLDRLQLALLRADRIPDDLLSALTEAATHLAKAEDVSAAEWQPLVMRLKVELARHAARPATLPPLAEQAKA